MDKQTIDTLRALELKLHDEGDSVNSFALVQAIMVLEGKASPAHTESAAPVAMSAQQLYDEIEQVLLHYRHSTIRTEDGDSGYPLTDLLTVDGHTIQMGYDEIRYICDAIYNDVLTKHAPAPSPTESAAPVDLSAHAYGCNCNECARKFYQPPAPSPVSGADEFIRDVAAQKPEKPDYWSACGQCERNAERAQDILEARAALAPTPTDKVSADEPLFADDSERDEFVRAVQEFEDCNETSVDDTLLMKWAASGLLECNHFLVTSKGNLAFDEAKRSQS